MYIESVPNRHSPPAILLRESYREAGKVRKRTLANLSKWPPVVVEGLRILLKGGTAVADLSSAFDITRSRPHGHVAAVLGTLRKLRLDRTVRAYKGLSVVERAFRSLKTVDLKVRPIYHYAGARVRAHVFLCMLAYYVEWHMRQRLKPLLFDDEEPDVAEAARPSVVAPGEVSPSAQDKARRKRTASGEPVHSFRTLLDDLATVANNRVVAALADAKPFDLITRPTALQRKAFKLLGVRLERTQ